MPKTLAHHFQNVIYIMLRLVTKFFNMILALMPGIHLAASRPVSGISLQSPPPSAMAAVQFFYLGVLTEMESAPEAYYRFSPTNGVVPVGSMVSARDSFAAAELNGKIYVFGGARTSFAGAGTVTGCTDTSEVFDPAIGRSQPIASLPTPLINAAAASIGGKIYVTGGLAVQVQCSPSPGFFNGTLSSSVYVYDPTTDTWSTAPAMPTARQSPAAAAANGKIFTLGGDTGVTSNSPTSVVEVFAPPIYINIKN